MRGRLALVVVVLSLVVATPVEPQSVFKLGLGSGEGERPLMQARKTLSIAQVTSLNSTPVALLPAVTGYFYAAEYTVCMHTGPYLSSPGNLVLRVVGQAVNFGSIPATTCLTNAVTNGFSAGFVLSPGAGGASDAATQYCSKGVEIHNLTGNPTVDGGTPGSPVTILFVYRLLPCYSTRS